MSVPGFAASTPVFSAAALAAPAIDPGTPPDGAMNVMPLLAEIADRMARWQPGEPSHVLNVSLLPMTPADMAYLQACLGTGPVALAAGAEAAGEGQDEEESAADDHGCDDGGLGGGGRS